MCHYLIARYTQYDEIAAVDSHKENTWWLQNGKLYNNLGYTANVLTVKFADVCLQTRTNCICFGLLLCNTVLLDRNFTLLVTY